MSVLDTVIDVSGCHYNLDNKAGDQLQFINADIS